MFIGHQPGQIEASARIGAAVVELHTGHYCDLIEAGREDEAARELAALRAASTRAQALASKSTWPTAFDFETAAHVCFPEVRELNIGHFLIGEAIFRGSAPRSRKCAAGSTPPRAPEAWHPATLVRRFYHDVWNRADTNAARALLPPTSVSVPRSPRTGRA